MAGDHKEPQWREVTTCRMAQVATIAPSSYVKTPKNQECSKQPRTSRRHGAGTRLVSAYSYFVLDCINRLSITFRYYRGLNGHESIELPRGPSQPPKRPLSGQDTKQLGQPRTARREPSSHQDAEWSGGCWMVRRALNSGSGSSDDSGPCEFRLACY